jgi:beta-lactamase class C
MPAEQITLENARSAGLDPDKLGRAFTLLQGWVEDGILPGAAALVTRGGRIAGEAYVGLAHRAEGRPVSPETIWSLASITKPFTATAVMLLVEEGHFALDEPLHQLVPEFLDALENGFDRKAVTLRHCLAHCSGLPGFSPDNTDLRKAHRPLEDFVGSFGRQPLFFVPGTAHLYSNPGILLAAEVVGRTLAGTLGRRVETPDVGRFHGFVHKRILEPLGMRSSSLLPPEAWHGRIAWVERTGQESTNHDMANSAYYRSLGIPWGGMFSTPRDLVRFVDLFLPTAAGRQRVGLSGAEVPAIVSPATARQMVSVQYAPPDYLQPISPVYRDAAAAFEPPLPLIEWGIGWELKGSKRSARSGELRSGDLTSDATFGHVGATGTMAWADPAVDVACILLTNRTLVSGWTIERPRQALFSNAVMAAVV